MQKYKGNLDSARIRTINGYQYAIFVINQKEIANKLGVTPLLCKYIPLFRDLLEMEAKGLKKTFIFASLGEKYGIHPSSVKRIRRKFLKTISI